MDLAQLAKIIKTYIEKVVSNNKFKETPGASYILRQIMSLPPTKRLVKTTLSNKEIVKLSFIIFFMFKGDDIETAIWRSENEVYMLSLSDVDDLFARDVQCWSCEGLGQADCRECLNTGVETCQECEGTGEGEPYGDSDEDDECGMCNGSGEIECTECDGMGTTNCDDCSDGEVEDTEESVHFGSSIWAIGDVNMVEKLNELNHQNYTHEITEVLDSNKGAVILLKSESEVDHELIDDFEDEHGPYWDLKDSSRIEYLKSFSEISPLYFKDDVNKIKFTGV